MMTKQDGTFRNVTFYLSGASKIPFFEFGDRLFSLATHTELYCGDSVRQSTIMDAKKVTWQTCLAQAKSEEHRLSKSVTSESALRTWVRKIRKETKSMKEKK